MKPSPTRSTPALLAAAIATAMAGLTAAPAHAHRLSFSKGRWIITPTAGTVTLELAIDALAVPPVAKVEPPTGARARAAWWPAHEAAVQAAFGRGMTLVSDAGACARAAQTIETRKGGDMLVMGYRWTCQAPITSLRLELGYVNALPPDHKHIARVDVGGRMTLRSFSHATPTWDVPADLLAPPARAAGASASAAASHTPPAPDSSRAADGGSMGFGELFIAGIHHIWTGWDHLAFLLALLAIGGRFRYLLGIVTSFTVAHSLSLGLAAFHVVELDSRLVEAGIAATIVFVAVENFWIREGRWRWLLTFAFGLIHGFGFASFLGDLELPSSALASALVAFNLGVEAGQIAVVAAVFPLLLWLSRKPWHRRWVVYPVSALIASAGLWWLVERTVLAA